MTDRTNFARSVLMPQQSTIAGFAFDPQTTQLLWRSIDKEVARLIREQGLRAFEMPRSSAIAHETGHVVVAAHDGVVLAYADISRRIVERRAAWTGFTKSAQPYQLELMLTDPATDPPRNILLRTCNLIAGVVGEQILDPAGYREGSSLDEIIVSQVLAVSLTHRPEYQHVNPKTLWEDSWRRTAMVIHGNQKLACAIMTNLDAFGIVRRKQIAKLTNNRRLSNDPLDGIIKDGST
jgi:hypothetical protein